MIHFNPAEGHPTEGNPCREQLSRYREMVAQVEALRHQVRKAKQAAVESLARLNEAPGPHDSGNIVFVTLLDAHSRDREELFIAMRRLDEACDTLRSMAGKFDIPHAGRTAAQ